MLEMCLGSAALSVWHSVRAQHWLKKGACAFQPQPTILPSLRYTYLLPAPTPAARVSAEQGHRRRHSPQLLVQHFDVSILHQRVVGLNAPSFLEARWGLLNFVPSSKILHRQQQAEKTPGALWGPADSFPLLS